MDNKKIVLFLAANPKDTDELRLGEEIREITREIETAEYRNSLELKSAWAVRPGDLQKALMKYKPHIVHFSGHGSRSGEIVLEDKSGNHKTVSPEAIKNLFNILKGDIRVVVLNACYSRIQAEAITGVIDCAIGMKRAVGDKAAIAFAASFYRAVGFGYSVQTAFDLGKNELQLEDIPEENTPDLLAKRGVDPSSIYLIEGLTLPPPSLDANEKVEEILRNLPQEEERTSKILKAAKIFQSFEANKRSEDILESVRNHLIWVIETVKNIRKRMKAGEILGKLGDPRIGFDKEERMLLVDAGEFTMGSNEYHDREKPERVYSLKDFRIGKYPVTNKEYEEFIADGGYIREEFWTEKGWQWKIAENINEPLFRDDNTYNGANSPVVGVSWYEACAYANWLSRKTGEKYRLPTKAEWEKAARGTRGSIYPWGDYFDKNKCNSSELEWLQSSSPVGIFPGGSSPYGCLDMAGNVWEWCSDQYEAGGSKDCDGSDPGECRVVRGGSWHNSADECRASYIRGYHTAYRLEYFGFRLVKEL